MKSNFLQTLVTALLLIAGTSSSHAQEQVSMRLDVVSWGDEISGLSLRSAGGTPFTAQPFRYSKPQSYSGPSVLEIYQEAASATPAAPVAPEELTKLSPALKQLLERKKTSPGLVALAALPAGSKRATVLLLPVSGGLFLAHVIDDDPSKLPVGRLRVHNLSPHPLAIRFGGKDSIQIPLHGSCIATPVNQEVIYELAYQKDEAWIVQENNLMPVASDEQTQMIVLQSDSGHFRSANGSRAGYLQVVTLRRSPKEPVAVAEISKAEREAAEKEAKRQNDAMDEAAKPKSGPAQPKRNR